MAQNYDLRNLIPEDDRDTITMRDGKTFLLPEMGVKEMGKLLLMEEEVGADGAVRETLAEVNDRLVKMLREANPGKKVPDYDFSAREILNVISIFAGAGTVSDVVMDALSKVGEDDTTPEAAMEAARQLAEQAGLRDESDAAPLASVAPSRKRSSRSATSGTGVRNGGKKSGGPSSSRTSKKPSASRLG